MNTAMFVILAEHGWRKLATGVAIDTGVIDKKITGNIFRQPSLNISHRQSALSSLAQYSFLPTAADATAPAILGPNLKRNAVADPVDQAGASPLPNFSIF